MSRNDASLALVASAMIVPTRFGLKYAPIPTLALEYEDDLKGVVDATGESSTSLYVYRETDSLQPVRKLHVVELPMLTRSSETEQITRQLQQDNGRFLAPEVVSEAQLKRLLDRLVENLPSSLTAETEQREPSLIVTREADSVVKEEEASESELEESVMEASNMEESVAEASRSDEYEAPQIATTLEVAPNRGAFVSHEAERDREEGSGDEEEADTGVKIDSHDKDEESQDENAPTAASPAGKETESEAEEDAKKTRALRSESDVSEEDVQSEELEYFSEDGSDEDSF